jgi:hypothetical protein
METQVTFKATAGRVAELRAMLAECGATSARVRKFENGTARVVVPVGQVDAARDAFVMIGVCHQTGFSFGDPKTMNFWQTWKGESQVMVRFTA